MIGAEATFELTDKELTRAKQLYATSVGVYVMKRAVTKNVLQAIRSVLDGKLYLSEKIAATMAEKLIEGRPTAARFPVELLSNRELEVFQLLGCGRTNRQIAEELHVSFKTVQAFCARIKAKLKLSNKTELLRAAVRWNDKQYAQ